MDIILETLITCGFWPLIDTLSLLFQHLDETLGVHPGNGELFINGLHIDLDIHNPFR